MGDDRRRDEPRPGDPSEGVRIIGAEEAAEAIERGDVAARRGGDVPRYGDRPARPAAGPKPALRFPLDAGSDPTEAAPVRPASGTRFDPRPPPAWDDPAPADDEGGDDPWPDTGAWAGAEPGWEDPKDDVVAWSSGETAATPAVDTGDPGPSGLSWADDFVGDDDEDPWDGTWDEPTGSVTWADDLPEASGEVTAAADGDADDTDITTVGDGVDVRRRGRRLFARSSAPADEPDEPAAAEVAALPEADEADAAEVAALPEADEDDEVAGAPVAAEVDVDVSDDAVVADITDDAVAAVGPDDEGFFDAAVYDSAETPAVSPSGDGDDADDEEEGAGLFDADGGWADPEPVFSFDEEPSGGVELPHWTEPGTGELPRVLAGDDAPVSGSTPAVHWRSHDAGWGDGGFDDLADDDRVGALDVDRPHDDDIYSFDELDPEPEPEPVGGIPARRVPPARPPVDQGPPVGGAAGRNLPVAIGVGVGAAVVALITFAIGPAAAVLLVAVVLFLAIVEYQNALRRAGYRPAALFGIVASVCYPFAVYWQGVDAYPLLLVLTVAAAMAWHVVGADGDARMVESVGVTLLGVLWIGGLGSFAALLLSQPDGIGLLLAAIIATVAYDVGGLAVGRSMGTRPLSAASPNKTWEGLVGGMLVALFVMIVWGLFGVAPLDGPGVALEVGLFAALVAPLGDLCESQVKRDLGIKDMGSILPEHGGVLDRFDALLFVLPAVYYATVFWGIGAFA